jgi:hypothetical protein
MIRDALKDYLEPRLAAAGWVLHASDHDRLVYYHTTGAYGCLEIRVDERDNSLTTEFLHTITDHHTFDLNDPHCLDELGRSLLPFCAHIPRAPTTEAEWQDIKRYHESAIKRAELMITHARFAKQRAEEEACIASGGHFDNGFSAAGYGMCERCGTVLG